MNKKLRNFLLVLLGASICFGVVFLIVKIWERAAMKALTYETLASINAALFIELHDDNPNLQETFSSANGQWHFLTVSEYDETITEFDDKSYDLDAGSSRPLLDLWGNRFEIGYRKLPRGFYAFVVFSKGPDGLFETWDDVAVSISKGPDGLYYGTADDIATALKEYVDD